MVNVGGEWFYDEYAHGTGIASVGLDTPSATATTEEEKRSILDLFKN